MKEPLDKQKYLDPMNIHRWTDEIDFYRFSFDVNNVWKSIYNHIKIVGKFISSDRNSPWIFSMILALVQLYWFFAYNAPDLNPAIYILFYWLKIVLFRYKPQKNRLLMLTMEVQFFYFHSFLLYKYFSL